MIKFADVWNSHPYPAKPCDLMFENQCAIRMTVALHGAGVNTKLLSGVRCWHKHTKPSHVLRAQELANALAKKPTLLGKSVSVIKMKGTINDNISSFKGKKGIVFIQDGWGSTDHIDAWDGALNLLKGTSNSTDYLAKGKQVWLWTMA